MKHLLTVVVFLLLGNAAAYSDSYREVDCKTFIVGSTSGTKANATLATVSSTAFTINPSMAQSVFLSSEEYLVLKNFPTTESGTSTLQLRKTQSFVDQNVLWNIGNRFKRPTPVNITYVGFAIEDPSMRVYLTYIDGELFAMLKDKSNGFIRVLAPTWDVGSAKGEHVLVNDFDGKYKPDFHCYADDMKLKMEKEGVYDVKSDEGKAPAALSVSGPLLQVDVLLEVDYPVYLKHRSGVDEETAINRTIAYLTTLFAQSSQLYEDEVNVVLKLTDEPTLWLAKSDPGYPGYQDTPSDVGIMLQRFASRWAGNNTPRDIAHLVTSNVSGSGIFAAGVAYTGNNYTGAMCLRGVGGGHGVSSINTGTTLPVLRYEWDAMVITHEMGHNFSSPHTHYCESGSPWPNGAPLDTCVTDDGTANGIGDACKLPASARKCPTDYWLGKGTIMSYCHLFLNNCVNLEFGPIVAQKIRKGAETGVARGCVAEPADPIVKIQYPLGRNLFTSGVVDTVRFTTSKVVSVRGEYSTNNGESWNLIADKVPSGNRKIPFPLPEIATDQALVRVVDESNSQVFDQSWTTFTIRATSLSVKSPAGGETFGQSEDIQLSIAKTLIDKVDIDFSSDGGQNWTTIQKDFTGTTFTWEPENITTTQGIFRVVTTDGETERRSGLFSIAKEELFLVRPMAKAQACAGKPFQFEWNTKNIASTSSNVRYDYSIDNGVEWTRIGTTIGTSALSGSYTWNIPSNFPPNDNVIVRLVYRNDTSVTVVSGVFKVGPETNCTVNSVQETLAEIEQVEIFPNPISTLADIRLTLKAPLSNVELTLYNTAGKKVAEIARYSSMPIGEVEQQLDMTVLPSGGYYIVVKSAGRTMNIPFVVSR